MRTRILFLLLIITALAAWLWTNQDILSWKTMEESVVSCPKGYSLVNGRKEYQVTDFCVAQYEMRFNIKTNKAISAKDGFLWNSVTKRGALNACVDMGKGYQLINNAQWQTVAQEIEENPENWSSGKVGVGCLFNGKPSGRNCRYSNVLKKRPYIPFALKLKSGEKVFDFANNLWEIIDTGGADADLGEDIYAHIVSSQTHPTLFRLSHDGVKGDTKFHFGPKRSYLFEKNFKGGLGKLYLRSSRGLVFRGGELEEKTQGVFATLISSDPNFSADHIGFRCIYQL